MCGTGITLEPDQHIVVLGKLRHPGVGFTNIKGLYEGYRWGFQHIKISTQKNEIILNIYFSPAGGLKRNEYNVYQQMDWCQVVTSPSAGNNFILDVLGLFKRLEVPILSLPK